MAAEETAALAGVAAWLGGAAAAPEDCLRLSLSEEGEGEGEGDGVTADAGAEGFSEDEEDTPAGFCAEVGEGSRRGEDEPPGAVAPPRGEEEEEAVNAKPIAERVD